MPNKLNIRIGDTVQLLGNDALSTHFDECVLVKSIQRFGSMFDDQANTFIVFGVCEHGSLLTFTVSAETFEVGMPFGLGFGVVPGLKAVKVPVTAL